MGVVCCKPTPVLDTSLDYQALPHHPPTTHDLVALQNDIVAIFQRIPQWYTAREVKRWLQNPDVTVECVDQLMANMEETGVLQSQPQATGITYYALTATPLL